MLVWHVPKRALRFGDQTLDQLVPSSFMCAIGSINSHYFHIIGDGKLNPIVGFYMLLIRIPSLKVWLFPSPNKRDFCLTMAHVVNGALKVGLMALKVGLMALKVRLMALKVGLMALKVGLMALKVGLMALKVGLMALKVGLMALKVGLKIKGISRCPQKMVALSHKASHKLPTIYRSGMGSFPKGGTIPRSTWEFP